MDYRCKLVLQNPNCHSLWNKINETFGEITLNYGKGNENYANMSACHLSSILGYEQMISWTMQTADQGIGSVSQMQQQSWLLLKASCSIRKVCIFGVWMSLCKVKYVLSSLRWDFWIEIGCRKIRILWASVSWFKFLLVALLL